MTWFAVYEIATGELVSIGTVVADPLRDGLAAVDLGEDFEQAGRVWNAQTLAFESPPVVRQTLLSKLDFVNRFTMAEIARILGAQAADAGVAAFMFKLNVATTVDLTHADVQQGVGYIAQKNLIDPSRVAEILA